MNIQSFFNNKCLAPILFLFVMMLNQSFTEASNNQSEIPDPEKWYREQYVPLWEEEPGTKSEQTATFYHTEIQVHQPDGQVLTLDTGSWIDEILAGWLADGWTGSEVPDIRVHRINDSTVSFTTRWLDFYKGGHEEYSCAWYLADLIDHEWKFTHYAEMDCAEQDY